MTNPTYLPPPSSSASQTVASIAPRQKVATAFAEPALTGRLVLAGGQPLHEVARYLAACDVLALPSWAEGTPNVVLEAIAAARPVVATRVGGIPDVIEDERTGILVPPRDPAALCDALRSALSRPWDEAALVERGAA